MTTKPERRAKPLPAPDELTASFWAAAKERRLVIQRCKGCGHFNHPPRGQCDICVSEDLEYQEVSGRGKVYSYTLMYQKNVPGFEGEIPYLNVAVELEEQPDLILVTNLVDATPEEVAIGRPAEVVFQRVNDEITLPQFRLVP